MITYMLLCGRGLDSRERAGGHLTVKEVAAIEEGGHAPPQTTLAFLQTGEVAIVAGINASSRRVKRLADMGFVNGVPVEMMRPGRPCIVRVGGVCLALGHAHQIVVKVTLQAR